jgi:hypothetical protein
MHRSKRGSRVALVLNHLIGARKYGCWNVEAQRLRSLKTDHRLVLGQCLRRQISTLLAVSLRCPSMAARLKHM